MTHKETERLFLDAFIRHIGWDVCEVTSREEPDFIVTTSDSVFGLELTQLFKNVSAPGGSSNKASEASRSQFMSKLADEYYRSDSRAILLTANFAEPPVFTALSEIANRVRAAVPETEWETSEVNVETRSGLRTKLYIQRLPDSCEQYRRWICINNSLGWVRSLDVDEILARIRVKAGRLSSYKSAVDRVRLLLVVDRTRESSMFSWTPTESPMPSLGFEGVYLYFHPDEAFHVAW
jgi:hypothetical protein